MAYVFLHVVAICFLVYSAGSQGKDGHVDVYIDSSEPVKTGELLLLKCVAVNFTQLLQVKWKKHSMFESVKRKAYEIDLRTSNRFRLSMNQSNIARQVFSVVIFSVNYGDDGLYSCNIEFNSAIFTDTVLVEVVDCRKSHLDGVGLPSPASTPIMSGKPQIEKKISTKHVILGHKVDISCHFHAKPTTSDVTWYGPANQKLSNDTKSQKYFLHSSQSSYDGLTFLVIISFTKQDVGKYTCRVQNAFGFDEHVIHLKGNPFVALVSADMTSSVDYWTTRLFRCMAANFPSGADIEISWYMRTQFGAPIKLHAFTFKYGSEIKITTWLENSTGATLEHLIGASMEHSTGATLEQSTGTTLGRSTGATLQHATSATLRQSLGTTLEHSTATTLEHPADATLGVLTLSELTVVNITYMFDGKLVCTTTWDGEVYDTSINISVRGEPEIHTSGPVSSRLGEFVEMECNVTARPPAYIVDWFFNDSRLDFHSRSHKIDNKFVAMMTVSRLTIFLVTHRDIGIYRCQAENDFGVQSAAINLEEQTDCHIHKCKRTRYCVNGTTCVCRPGFISLGEDTCIDVNECTDHHNCDQDCKNTLGSYKCACFVGYTLAEDGTTCNVYSVVNSAILSTLLVGVGIGASVVLVVGIAVLACICLKRHCNMNNPSIDTEQDSEFGNVLYTRQEHLWDIDQGGSLGRPSDEFPRDRLKFVETIGTGTFGMIYRAHALSITGTGTWEVVTVKLCRECATDLDKEYLYNELDIVKKIPVHMNVVSFYGCCTIDDPLLLIMEYVCGGNLLEYLRKRRPENPASHDYYNELTAKDLLSFAVQSARGMSHLSHNNIVHRDVAARNILIGSHKICKISDFGLARDVEGIDIYERTSKGPLPIRWMAPESLTEGLHSHKSDVWSYGVLVWEIVTLGASPYSDLSLKDVIEAVVTGQTLDKPQHCTEQLYDLMCLCWFKQSVSRPDFSSICENLEWLLEREADYIQLDQFQEHIYTVLEPDAMDERL